MGSVVVSAADPREADIVELLTAHLRFADEHSPPEDVHALDVQALCAPSISFFAARDGGRLVGVGALKELAADHGELKSMHTAAVARRRGVGAVMLAHLLEVARRRHYRAVSLETGTPAAFEPAYRMYRAAGFTDCPPFADYQPSSYSRFMTLRLDTEAAERPVM